MSEKTKVKGDHTGYGVIHEEYAGRVSENHCFRRHEITPEQWRKMTAPDELRFWKARGVQRTYTAIGYGVYSHSRRRWGDNLKVIDHFSVVKAGTEYTPVRIDIDEAASA